MFSSGSPDKSKRVCEENRMPPDGKAQMITCQGCGQVGTIDIDSSAFGGRHRRHGFYLHERGNAQVVACCKCQQIQPLNGNRG